MKFDTVILGGGLSGLVSGICLQQAGRSTAIISNGQNALHFFSGGFESVEEAPQRMEELFSEAGIRLHYRSGVRLMPLGTFREAVLALEDIDLFPTPKFGNKVLILNIKGYSDFFPSFLAEGLSRQGMTCREELLLVPELEQFRLNRGEMRSVQIARVLDPIWPAVVQAVRSLLKDEDSVVLPQVFGLQDADVPARIRQEVPARVIFAGTLPPSVPGIRTQQLLKKRYEVLGGTYLKGDEALSAEMDGDRVRGIVTRNLDRHHLEAEHFILSTGSFFSKGLAANPFGVRETVFGLDVEAESDRSDWYHPDFLQDQPYLRFGVRTDDYLHPLLDGKPVRNLYAAGSILGGTRPEFGSGAGLAIRSAFFAVDTILNTAQS